MLRNFYLSKCFLQDFFNTCFLKTFFTAFFKTFQDISRPIFKIFFLKTFSSRFLRDLFLQMPIMRRTHGCNLGWRIVHTWLLCNILGDVFSKRFFLRDVFSSSFCFMIFFIPQDIFEKFLSSNFFFFEIFFFLQDGFSSETSYDRAYTRHVLIRWTLKFS